MAWHLLIALWVLAGAASAHAQSPPPLQATSEPSPPRVVNVSGRLELDKILEVQVDGLAGWGKTPGHTPWKLVPYVDGRALTGLYPLAVNLRTGTVQFHLRITPENRTIWTHVLSPLVFERAVRFSAGLELQDPFETDFTLEGRPAMLTVINPRGMALATLVVLVFAGAFCALASRTTLLMERVTSASGPPSLRFSLAKVQLALWFFVVFGAFLVIWLVTGNFNTIDNSIVATLGISAGTALGDAYIKSARPSSGSPGAAASELPQTLPRWTAVRFVHDLISDDEGYSIYRFQMLAWTAALVIVFLADVYDDLVMPAFGPELLYLLGLSSGTYVAHRMPEVQRDHQRSDPAAPPSPAASAWPDSAAMAPPRPGAAPAASPSGRTG